ncbi:MAG: transglycosylase SLT domain-containing protein [Xanthomonadales bacterium]|nr:transglycosylase SLT domain-containing protein [Xanthomonadales bacterium]
MTFFVGLLGFILLALVGPTQAKVLVDPSVTQFKQTWNLARAGRHAEFRLQMPGSKQYLLYPYLQYEDYRSRLSSVPPAELAAFLQSHKGWAFSSGLRQAWLRGLGRKRQWSKLLQYAGSFQSIRSAETRCNQLNARINSQHQKSEKAALIQDAGEMWRTGKSQHKACDPVFSWMDRHNHLNDQLVWQRLLLAFQAGNLNLANYLKRRLPPAEQAQVDAFIQLWKNPGHGFSASRHWSDSGRTREIILAVLLKQARKNPDAALKYWQQVEHEFSWSERAKGKILYDIVLFSAVALDDDVLARFALMPAAAVDDRLLQWRLRTALNHQRWDELLISFDSMSAKAKSETRFRYWQAWALEQQGEVGKADVVFKALAREATFWGFLAADHLQQDYRICPITPTVDPLEIQRIAALPGVKRALELRKVGLDDFAGREWYRATVSLSKPDMRLAAALATDKGWPSRAILGLGKSGDTRYYDWRFPIAFEQHINRNANKHNLDPAWIYGLMRAESAMNPRAISPAKAYGLMQLLPSTAKHLSKRAGVKYTNRTKLLEPAANIAFGTAEMSKLLERYQGVPAYVTGAYNAGPGAVDRWLKQRPGKSVEAWLELMPYYETRDYIPRVMAFSTLYAWRLGTPVTRVSHRLRHAATATNGAGIARVSCSP